MKGKIVVSYSDKLFKKVPFVRNLLEDAKNPEIFHYTKPSKLLSILETEKIRFSNVLCLNDKDEVTYSYKLIIKLLEELDVLNLELKEKIRTHFLNKCNYITETSDELNYSFEYYTSSFSTNSDNLTLWNNYTKDKTYTGYNIGFNKKKLVSEMIENKFSLIYGAIIYDKKKQIQILKAILLKWNTKFEKAMQSKKVQIDGNTTRLIDILLELSDVLSLISIFFKNPNFKNEQEYRIVFVNNVSQKTAQKINVMEKNGIFVPFLEYKFGKGTVNAINIGPTLNENIFKTSTHRMLLNFGYENVAVNQSKIPLRY